MKRILEKTITILIMLIFILSTFPKDVLATNYTVVPTDVSVPGQGNIFILRDVTYIPADAQAIINRVNAIRQEAFNEGLVPEYKPIQWDNGMALAAQYRAAEITIMFYHDRTGSSGPRYMDEDLSAGGDQTSALMAAIENWYSEKGTDNTGHYDDMINPSYTYMGMGGAFASDFVFGIGVAGLFNSSPYGNGNAMKGTYSQILEVNDKVISSITLSPINPMNIGDTEPTTPSIMSKEYYMGSTMVNRSIPLQYHSGGDWSSTDESVVTVDGNGNITAAGAGTADVTLTVGSISASVTVTVNPPRTVVSVEPVSVVTDSGIAPVLPSEVTATYSDGSTGPVSVTWATIDSSMYSGRNGGEFTVEGDAAGIIANAQVTVNPATVTSVDGYDVAVETPAGTPPTLSPNADVHWSNGDVENVQISWENIDPALYSDRNGGTFTVNGNAGGNTVTTQVTVLPATVASVKPVPQVTTPSGTAPVLPGTTEVTWSDGAVTTENITWPDISPDSYSGRNGGTFQVSGTVAGQTVTVDVVVEPATLVSIDYVKEVTTIEGNAPVLPADATITYSNNETVTAPISWDPVDPQSYSTAGNKFTVNGKADGNAVAVNVTVVGKTITSIEYTKEYTTPYNTPVELPGTLKFLYDDGSSEMLPVTWSSVPQGAYVIKEGNTFTLTGTIADRTVDVTITVLPDEPVSASVPASVTTESGTAPVLPKTVKVTWKSGETTDEAVTWDNVPADKYSDRKGGTFTVNGTVRGLSTQVSVKVNPATVVSTNYTKNITTQMKVAPVLPDKVEIVYSNGETVVVIPVWDPVDPSQYDMAGKKFTVAGKADGTDISVEVTVIAVAIKNIDYPKNLTTDYDVPVTLPDTVKVIYEDNTTEMVTATWDQIPASMYTIAEGNQFVVNGTAAGQQLQITINVNPARAVSYTRPDTVITESGTAPVLPSTVKVTYESGEVKDVPVIWKQVPQDLYMKREGGQFQVMGRAGEMDVAVDVTVNPATAVSADYPKNITTKVMVAPVLPETVMVTYSNGDKIEVPATWTAVSPASYSRAGNTFTVNGSADGLALSVTVNVTDRAITGLTYTKEYTTDFNTAVTLPETVTATYDNGETEEVAVIWEKVDDSRYQIPAGNIFTVKGAAAGNQVEVKITVKAAEILDVEKLADVITEAGVYPDLPKTAKVTWGVKPLVRMAADGSSMVTEEPIVWEPIPEKLYKVIKGHTFEAKGTVVGREITVNVIVKDAFIKSIRLEHDTYVTQIGKSPVLSDKATVLWSSGKTTEDSVIWEKIDEKLLNKAGEFTLNGQLKENGNPVKVKITVTDNRVVPTGAVDPTPITIVEGMIPKLPEKVYIMYSDGKIRETAYVIWETVDITRYYEAGQVTVIGKTVPYGYEVKQVINVIKNQGSVPQVPGPPEPTLPNTGGEFNFMVVILGVGLLMAGIASGRRKNSENI